MEAMLGNSIGEDTYEKVEDLASDLKIGRQATYAGLRNGTIPAIRIGRRYVIPKSAIREWLKTAGGKLA